jgi:hypothetical protein
MQLGKRAMRWMSLNCQCRIKDTEMLADLLVRFDGGIAGLMEVIEDDLNPSFDR